MRDALLSSADFPNAICGRDARAIAPAPLAGIDWICVSSKGTASLVLTGSNELKLVFPQVQAMPEAFAHLDFQHFFLQPMDGPNRVENTRLAVQYCMQHPQWRLSLQTHKYIGIP